VKWSLPEIALRRPITVTMIIVTMLGLGFISLQRIPIEFIPKFEFPFLGVYIPYVGATPEQVENEIAIPAEGQFRTLTNLQRITTQSDMNGCNVLMQFQGVDLSTATSEVRDRMERLRAELPADVDRLMLRKFSSEALPVMIFALYRDQDIERLADAARTVLQPRLLRIDGVADVAIFGEEQAEVLVEFDQDKLRARGLSLYEVVQRLQLSNLNVALGELIDGNQKHFVRALGEFKSPQELGELVIGPNAARLKDVANVGYLKRTSTSGYAIDGQTGVAIMIRKESEANTVRTCTAVKAELAKILDEPLFVNTEQFVFFDQSEMILGALDGLIRAGQWGGALSFIVLFLFLRRLRLTLVVALSIPASLFVAFILMYFAGYTLNIITIIAMIVALGMLVDNAIVVMENIHRHSQEGHSDEESARRGANEVSLAITAATATTCAAFLPLVFLDTGDLSNYIRQFAVPVTVALGASLLLAVTAIPLAACHLPTRESLWTFRIWSRINPFRRRGSENGGKTPARRIWSRPGEKVVSVYLWVLGWTQRWRLATLLILGAVFLSTIPACMGLQRQGVPSIDSRQVVIDVEFERGFDAEEVQETFGLVYKKVDARREELGIKNIFYQYGPHGGNFNIYLNTEDDLRGGAEYKYTTDEARDILWASLPAAIPGAELRFSIAETGEQSSQGFSIRMRGDDATTLNEYASRFAALLQETPNVTEAKAEADSTEEEIQILINETFAARNGVSPFTIAQTVDFALRGARIFYIKREGREIPVWAQFSEKDRTSRANLENVAILNQEGELVPLIQLVDFQKARSPSSIRRVNGKNVVNITATTRTRDLGRVMDDLRGLIQTFDMPRGYNIEFGDELASLQSDMTAFMTAMLLAIIVIYLIMGSLFESYLLPISILVSVPLAGIGVVWSMYATGTPIDTMTFIGFILLAGIVVNNGIVIIDHINQLRKEGMDRGEAILRAGRVRLRPVMMTALTTILGCVPLAVGEVTFSGLGRALIGGLTTGTLLTLIIVPLFYAVIDDVREWLADFAAALTGAREQSAA
jgi:hydrophobic/amphiphilic exporter-1 (mainly G- bacteria), HAE1 family